MSYPSTDNPLYTSPATARMEIDIEGLTWEQVVGFSQFVEQQIKLLREQNANPVDTSEADDLYAQYLNAMDIADKALAEVQRVNDAIVAFAAKRGILPQIDLTADDLPFGECGPDCPWCLAKRDELEGCFMNDLLGDECGEEDCSVCGSGMYDQTDFLADLPPLKPLAQNGWICVRCDLSVNPNEEICPRCSYL